MSFGSSGVLDRFRNREYTGSNRCLPCTVVNLLLAAVGAGVMVRVSLVGGVLCFAVFLLLIYFRGYLVPGTPRLTARYFPAWILRVFDKQPPQTDTVGRTSTLERLNTAENDSDVDPEIILELAGVIDSDIGQNGPSLSSSFDSQWQSRIEEVADNSESQRQELTRTLGSAEASIAFIDTEKGVIADADGTWVGTWPSRPALAADIAAEPLLQNTVDEWFDFDDGTRGTILQRLRMFVDTCPTCSGTVSSDTEYQSISCCRSVEYSHHRCDACGATIVRKEVS